MIDMTAITAKAAAFDYDVERINKELKRIASVKCRLKKFPNKRSFNEEMTAILQEEELLKCAKSYVSGPRKNVNTITQSEVDLLSLDETMKALRAIQSKKCHTKWLTTTPGDNDEYREACRIEQMLKDHRDALAPIKIGSVSKSDLKSLTASLRLCSDLSVEECLRRIEELTEVK